LSDDRLPNDVLPADPDAMRDYARALKADARELHDVASGVRSALRSMDFEGPAAERFEHRSRKAIRQLRTLAERLEEIARLVVAAADDVERERRRRGEEAGFVGVIVSEELWVGP
jgi:uncharacterized protein YukE